MRIVCASSPEEGQNKGGALVEQGELRSAGGVEYTLIRKRVKNLTLRLAPDGSVRVSAPLRAGAASVDAFVAAHADWVKRAEARHRATEAARAALAPPEKDQCLALFKEVSDGVFPRFEKVLGGKKPVIKVRDMRTRWGSCHPAKRQITLAARLALQPPAAIEYVVVHEYCHFVHPDHQAGFWALVESILPDWKARRALLRNPR
ncbi:MAG TPA: M48 family metallopeptidase [Candidatus Fournierella merdipullorum]|uniref:M48 family metallopeptidase n=1 Tax=Candidatus Allofournierella merdipullorum TaxID=2838595 RepID=A0A9D2E4N5_9FIRM|nr:M48 family metallopeptidase [Candidatus Fournierella merdipullorum]